MSGTKLSFDDLFLEVYRTEILQQELGLLQKLSRWHATGSASERIVCVTPVEKSLKYQRGEHESYATVQTVSTWISPSISPDESESKFLNELWESVARRLS